MSGAGDATLPPLAPLAMPPLAFAVGVTGHRTVAGDTARIERSVQLILRRIAERLEAGRNGSPLDRERPISLRLLSMLAAGADQLAARAAQAEGAGWQVEAVLPFPADAYRATLGDRLGDGEAERARTGFDALMAQRPRCFTFADWLPQPAGDRVGDYWRDRRYRMIGQLLVRQTDLLIAIWDGGPPSGVGGTADVVSEALRVGLPVLWIEPASGRIRSLMPPGPGARYDSAVPLNAVERAQTLLAATGAEGRRPARLAIDGAIRAVLAPTPPAHAHGAEAKWAGLAALTGHDAQGRRERARPRSMAFGYQLFLWAMLLFARDKRSGKSLQALQWPPLQVDDARRALADAPGADPADRMLDAAWCAADAIGTRLGHVYRTTYVAIFLIAAIAAGTGLASLFFDPHAKWMFVSAELVLLAGVIALFFASSSFAWHSRWLNARHVAESLRGVRPLVWLGFAGRRPMPADAPWSAWYANALIAVPGLPAATLDRPAIRAIAHALTRSVQQQVDYHAANYMRLSRLHRRLDVLGWLAVLAAAIMGAVFLGVTLAHMLHVAGEADVLRLKSATTFTGGFLPLFAGALAGVRFQGDFERFAERSRSTQAQLEELLPLLALLARRAEDESPDAMPVAEDAIDLALVVQERFEDDLEDWHFVYAARPTPGL
jgi:hypothetical protein